MTTNQKVIEALKMTGVVILVLIIFGFVWTRMVMDYPKRERIIPVKPFIVIETTQSRPGTAPEQVQYKILDQNGFVFYMTDLLQYPDYKQRFNLGDTIR